MKNSIQRVAPLFLVANYSLSSLERLPANPADAPVSTAAAQPGSTQPWMTQAGIAYILNSVPPPPQPGSASDKADLDGVLKAQSARTAADIEEARADQKFTLGLLTQVIGPDCTAAKYPISFALLEKVLHEEAFFSFTLKTKYQRPRPYVNHPEVKKLYSANTPGYPSDRAAASRIISLLMMELFPAKTNELLTRDLVIGQSGVTAGVGYPSDVIAGRNLAHALAFVIHDTPEFQSVLNKAKLETGAISAGVITK